jgi:ribosomal protein S18 acetylase RimI-like enzyme
VRGSTSILVLDVGGTVAGYATLGLNRARSLPQEGEIYELYLKPEFQGVGLGKRLFTEARQLLDSLGCKGVVVWCLEDNHPPSSSTASRAAATWPKATRHLTARA